MVDSKIVAKEITRSKNGLHMLSRSREINLNVVRGIINLAGEFVKEAIRVLQEK